MKLNRQKLPMHKQLALPALHAKKDVFVEWPLGNGLAEAEELAALAKKQGVKTVVGLQGRLQPPIVKVWHSEPPPIVWKYADAGFRPKRSSNPVPLAV